MPNFPIDLSSWIGGPRTDGIEAGIEDDTLGTLSRVPLWKNISTEAKCSLLGRSAEMGTHAINIGAPAKSTSDFIECRELVKYMWERDLGLIPRCTIRGRIEDTTPVVWLNEVTNLRVQADVSISVCAVRMRVAQMSTEGVLERVTSALSHLVDESVPYGISIEDATRTSPDDLAQVIDLCGSFGVSVITLCDTVGASDPLGALAIVRFVREKCQSLGLSTSIWWRGSNSLGLALPNALFAAMGGAQVIGGTMLGIGEQGGVVPLELVAAHLRKRYNLTAAQNYARSLAHQAGCQLPDQHPVVGPYSYVVASSEAEYLAAAREQRMGLERQVITSISPVELGREHEIFLSARSSEHVIRVALADLGSIREQGDIRSRVADTWPATSVRTFLGSKQ